MAEEVREPELLTPEQFCNRVRVGRSTLTRLMKTPPGIKHVRIGRRLFFRESHVIWFLERFERGPKEKKDKAA